MSKLRPWEKKEPQTCRILPGADQRRLEYGGGKCPLMDPVTGSFSHLHERVCRFRSSRHLFHLSNPFPPPPQHPAPPTSQRSANHLPPMPSHPVGGAGRQQPARQLLLLSRALGNRCGSGKKAHLAGAGRQQNNCRPSAPLLGLVFLIVSLGHRRCSEPR